MISTRTTVANEGVGTSYGVPPKMVKNFGKGNKFS